MLSSTPISFWVHRVQHISLHIILYNAQSRNTPLYQNIPWRPFVVPVC